MAKPITEEDLAAGVKSVGGFGGFTRPRVVDSPFRDSHAEPKPAAVRADVKAEVVARGSVPAVEAKPQVQRVEIPAVEPNPKKAPNRKQNRRVVSGRQIYTERVTIQLNPEMRDEVDELARQLQRAKTSKEERITANTVIAKNSGYV